MVAIVAILTAIGVSALVSARIEARRTPLIVQLRQIGAAASLYAADAPFPETSASLVKAGLLPSQLVSSSFDPLPNGLMNMHRSIDDDGIMWPVLPYRDSLLVAGEMIPPVVRPLLKQKSSYGWAVFTARAPSELYRESQSAGSLMWAVIHGPAFRLGEDGSVRRLNYVWQKNAAGNEEMNTQFIFVDRKDEVRFDEVTSGG